MTSIYYIVLCVGLECRLRHLYILQMRAKGRQKPPSARQKVQLSLCVLKWICPTKLKPHLEWSILYESNLCNLCSYDAESTVLLDDLDFAAALSGSTSDAGFKKKKKNTEKSASSAKSECIYHRFVGHYTC